MSRRWAIVLALAAAASVIAILATTVRSEHVAKHTRPAHTAARAPTARSVLYVDVGSIGGACNDDRSAAQARVPSTPMCTIGQALASAAPNTTILVRGGAYPALAVSGGHSAAVTIAAYNAEAVSLPSVAIAPGTSGVRFTGLRLTGSSSEPTLELGEGAHDIQIADSTMSSQAQDAIALRPGVRDVLIDANNISSRAPGATDGGDGIVFDSTSTLPGSPPGERSQAPIVGVRIRNNHFSNIGVDAIRPTNFVNLAIQGNDITGVAEHGNHSDAIQTVFGGRNLDIEANYVHDNNAEGILIKDGEVTNAYIANNVIVHTTLEIQLQVFDTIGLTIVNNTLWDNQYNIVLRAGVRHGVIRDNIFENEVAANLSQSAPYIEQDHNLVASGWNWGARGHHDISRRPRFVDQASGDFRLANGSAGIDAGSATGSPRFDKACRRRYDDPRVRNRGSGVPPFVDMGALEHGPMSLPGDTAAAFRQACGARPFGG